MNTTHVILVAAGAVCALAFLPSGRTGPAVAPEPARVVSSQPSTALSVRSDADGSLAMEARLASRWAANAGAANYLTVDLRAKELPQVSRSPVSMAVVIDRSGSMRGEKLEQAKEAARQLVGQLSENDRLAVVHYGSDVRHSESLPGTESGKAALRAFIDEIYSDGGTNISQALQEAARVLEASARDERPRRLTLISDGRPTEGEPDHQALAWITGAIRKGGVTVSALGVGSDFDELLMRRLVEEGGGFYGFIEDASRLSEVFRSELGNGARLVAREAELFIDTPQGVEIAEVLGRTVTKVGSSTVRVGLPDFSAGLSAKVIVRFTVALEEGESPQRLVELRLRHRDLQKEAIVESKLALSAPVTHDASLALSSADPEILRHAARAELAKQAQLAAVHVRAGRREEAARSLELSFDGFRKIFGMSADSLSGQDTAEYRAMIQSGNVKALENKSMKSFGENNTY